MNKTTKFVNIAREMGINPLVIYDLGSFDASQALELAGAFPKARVVALEADPFNVTKCIGNARGHPRIVVVSGALAGPDRSRLVQFYRSVGTNDQCGSLLMPTNAVEMPMELIAVPAVTAADLAQMFGSPALLWMDVQGSELSYFEGMPFRPRLVWMEVAYAIEYYGQASREETIKEMADLGYAAICEETGQVGRFGDICFRYDR